MGDNSQDQSTMDLPDAKSPNLMLTHPTPEERLETWRLTAKNWGAALKGEEYIEREKYLMTVPLAKDNGLTHWILVSRDEVPNERHILASCESLRKKAWISRSGVEGIKEVVTHGVGSVFCNPAYRGKGYASRMLKELRTVLKEWQTETQPCDFSFLYSDIGRTYYSNLGWLAFPSKHIAFPPAALPANSSSLAKPLTYPDIPALCEWDMQNIQQKLAKQNSGKIQVALVPDHDSMQWHHLREDFLTSKIFSKTPTIKGAIAGSPGSRVWAIWTRSFYGPISAESGNTLHVLRLVIEDESDVDDNAEKLMSILQMAQAEAVEWRLGHVEIWNPTPIVNELVRKTGLDFKLEDRQGESIASLMWYGEGKGTTDEIEWTANDKYGWC